MQVNGYFLPLEYSCCNLLHVCKDTLFTPAFGLLCSMIIPTSATRAVNDSLTPNLRKCFLFAKN